MAPEPDSLQLQTLQIILDRISLKFSVEFESLGIDGESLDILAIHNMPEHIDGLLRTKSLRNPLKDLPLWAKVWPASFVLGNFFHNFQTQDKTLLELGAGMGVCSLLAARHGFKNIQITDINEDALLFAQANILKNNLQEKIKARWLDVCQPPANLPLFDFICASEILYLEELRRPLLKFVSRHLAPCGTCLICNDMCRDNPHFQKMAAKNFKVRQGRLRVKCADENGDVSRRIYTILMLEKQ